MGYALLNMDIIHTKVHGPAGIIEIAVGGCTIVISGTDKPLYEI